MENSSILQIENSLPRIVAIRSLLIGDNLTKTDVLALKEVDIVQKYLELPLNDPAETKLKKALSAAILVIKDKGLLKMENDFTPEQIAFAVSEGLTRMKMAYLAEKGQTDNGILIDVEKASQVVNNHLVASIVTFVDKWIDDLCAKLPKQAEELTEEYYDKIISLATLYLTAYISDSLSPDIAQYVANIINSVASSLKPYVKEMIGQGSEKILRSLAPILKDVLPSIIKAAETMSQKIKRIFNQHPLKEEYQKS